MRQLVAVVPHTHWDREWYLPFQTFRLRLVDLLDALIPVLESDDAYDHFLLDGQTAVIDDYLALRPQMADRIAALAKRGRVSIGPWAILMDEYMVSGETIVRDLQRGLRRSADFGGPMEVGYLPDMFGHIAQMPQIFALAGLEHCVVWRGVPLAVDRTAFRWTAPDGSSVRAEYLIGGYSNGRDLPAAPEALIGRVDSFARESASFALPEGGLLLMNGTDHQLPQPHVGAVTRAANDAQDRYDFRVMSLRDYLVGQPNDGLAEWTGELRSGARANVLMGVASNRVDIHIACAHAERAIERHAEPASSLFLPAERFPHAQLGEAWRLLVLNSAHDSSCACSTDEVVDEVAVRYAQARQIGDGLTAFAYRAHASTVPSALEDVVVINPSAHEMCGLVEATVAGTTPVHFVDPDGQPCPTQSITTLGGEIYASTGVGDGIWPLIGMITLDGFNGTPIAHVNVTEVSPSEIDVTLTIAEATTERADLTSLRERVTLLAETDGTVTVRLVRPASQRVLVTTPPIDGFGWTTLSPRPGAASGGSVVGTPGAIANQHLRVAFDETTASVTIATNDGITLRDADRLVDGGDGGDTYNYSPPADDCIIDTPVSARVALLESGPLRAQLLVEREYDWPAFALGDERNTSARSDAVERTTVRTIYELRDHEPFVRVHVEFDNRSRDHRLRTHIPLPRPVTGSDAECAFTVVRRGLESEGSEQEFGLPTYVSRRFVECSDGVAGVALLHDGLLEYEVVDNGTALALTLLRATGYLARSEASLRPNPAGPTLPVEGAQLQRRVSMDYAIYPHHGHWFEADLYAQADAFLTPLASEPGGGTGEAPVRGTRLHVDGAEVSAVTRDDSGALIVRVFNPLPASNAMSITFDRAPLVGDVIDLRDRVVEPFDGTATLRRGQILTVRAQS